jgi:glycosyltransferase involved in cell wall biosynthesis
VGVPVFNEEHHLAECLASVVSQTYGDLEITVSDNASTDRTWDVVQHYARADERITAVRQNSNLGAPANFAHVLNRAIGAFHIWAGGHDRWAPDMLERCVGMLQAEPAAVLAVPMTKWTDDTGKVVGEDPGGIDTRPGRSAAARARIMYGQMTRCSAVYGLYRTPAVRQAFSALPRMVNADFIFLMRIAAAGHVITPAGAYWFRRRVERSGGREAVLRRHCEIYGVRGVAAAYPLTVSRIRTVLTLAGLRGPLRERAALIRYAVRKLFLDSAQRQILAAELLSKHGSNSCRTQSQR